MKHRYKKRAFKERICRDCGAKFETQAHNAFRCFKCREKFREEYRKHYKRKTNPRSKKGMHDYSEYINYSQGNSYCEKYNNDDIQCVICYEQRLKEETGCRKWEENQK